MVQLWFTQPNLTARSYGAQGGAGTSTSAFGAQAAAPLSNLTATEEFTEESTAANVKILQQVNYDNI